MKKPFNSLWIYLWPLVFWEIKLLNCSSQTIKAKYPTFYQLNVTCQLFCLEAFVGVGVCVRVCVCVSVCVLHGRRTNLSWKYNGSQMFVFQTKEKRSWKVVIARYLSLKWEWYDSTWSSLSQKFLWSEKFFSTVTMALIKRYRWSLIDFVTREELL